MAKLVEVHRFQTHVEGEQCAGAMTAAGIECFLIPVGSEVAVFVKTPDIAHARLQIAIYERENTPTKPATQHIRKSKHGLLGLILYVIVLIVFFLAHHMNAFSIDWLVIGSSQAGLIAEGAWWRPITSLTLHADFGHLLGNLVFGVIAGHFVAQRFGSGLAWLLILLAGSLGNWFNAFIHSPEHSAIGASTGLFGALGILAGYSHGSYIGPGRNRLRRWMPISAGIMLLAFLGFGGENTDVLGHILGFGVGIPIGLFLARVPQQLTSKVGVQRTSGTLALGLVSLAWLVTLSLALPE